MDLLSVGVFIALCLAWRAGVAGDADLAVALVLA